MFILFDSLRLTNESLDTHVNSFSNAVYDQKCKDCLKCKNCKN